MNVYDFDKTIYSKDTTAQFYLWCLKRYPVIVKRWPKTVVAAIKMLLKRCDKTAFKDVFMRFLQDIPSPEEELEAFWNENIGLIHKWYLKQQRDDDVVITASPVDFVRPACRRLNIRCVLGSPVDLKTGRYQGRNCHGEEKVRAFLNAFPGAAVENFYSDSDNDSPMAQMAEKAYKVHGEKVTVWMVKR